MSLIDPGLLKVLCCPETHQPVSEADAGTVAELNKQIASGSLKNRNGKAITDKIDGVLVRQDGRMVYPIRNRIPIMISEEGISLVRGTATT
jgi:uncharacterized protein